MFQRTITSSCARENRTAILKISEWINAWPDLCMNIILCADRFPFLHGPRRYVVLVSSEVLNAAQRSRAKGYGAGGASPDVKGR